MADELDRLLHAVAGARRVVILTHNDPDPDSIASALALRYLPAQEAERVAPSPTAASIRAENRALVRYLSNPLRLLTDVTCRARPVRVGDTNPAWVTTPGRPAGRRQW
jgi:nanoRNase/pAp phosphatase (c-di-AMP/oligoRNAs hydrolase)